MKKSGLQGPFLEWSAAVVRNNKKQVVNPGHYFLLFDFLDIEQVNTTVQGTYILESYVFLIH